MKRRRAAILAILIVAAIILANFGITYQGAVVSGPNGNGVISASPETPFEWPSKTQDEEGPEEEPEEEPEEPPEEQPRIIYLSLRTSIPPSGGGGSGGGGSTTMVATEVCNDEADNDLDGYTDCEDSDCFEDAYCIVEPPEPEMVCDDEVDNDEDGYTDCDDSDCFDDEACTEAPPAPEFAFILTPLSIIAVVLTFSYRITKRSQ
jgi:hypothetical protein